MSAVLSELISELFRALLEAGCCTLRADGDRMMIWLTCVSSLYLPLLSTEWRRCSTEEACIRESLWISNIRAQLRVHIADYVLHVKIYSFRGQCAAAVMHRKQVRKCYSCQLGACPSAMIIIKVQDIGHCVWRFFTNKLLCFCPCGPPHSTWQEVRGEHIFLLLEGILYLVTAASNIFLPCCPFATFSLPLCLALYRQCRHLCCV